MARFAGIVHGVVVQITTDGAVEIAVERVDDRELHHRSSARSSRDTRSRPRRARSSRPTTTSPASSRDRAGRVIANAHDLAGDLRFGVGKPWSSRGSSQSPSTPRRLNSSRCTSIQLLGEGAAFAAELDDRRRRPCPCPWRGTPPRSSTRSAGRGSPSPARSSSRSRACCCERDDDVLQDLVEGVADMDVAVGVGRAVVQHEARPALLRPRAGARRGSISSQRCRSCGSRCGRPARIGKSVFGRNSVSE